jgi:hypothetical protein
MSQRGRWLVLVLFGAVTGTRVVHAGMSTLTRAEGHSCLGEDKSRKQAEKEATDEARRHALEQAAVHVQSETHVKDAVVEKDLLSAYANGTVRVLQELAKEWYRDPAAGDCFRIEVAAEVIPDLDRMKKDLRESAGEPDPLAPLVVRIWSQKAEYRGGEKMKIYMRGNKPFFATIVYRDSGGNHLQLLPNPFRYENYFQGGVTYEIPSGEDRFDLTVKPPFGRDTAVLYASTVRLGALATSEMGGVYSVQTPHAEIGTRVRGIALTPKTPDFAPTAEFSEAEITVQTEP